MFSLSENCFPDVDGVFFRLVTISSCISTLMQVVHVFAIIRILMYMYSELFVINHVYINISMACCFC